MALAALPPASAARLRAAAATAAVITVAGRAIVGFAATHSAAAAFAVLALGGNVLKAILAATPRAAAAVAAFAVVLAFYGVIKATLAAAAPRDDDAILQLAAAFANIARSAAAVAREARIRLSRAAAVIAADLTIAVAADVHSEPFVRLHWDNRNNAPAASEDLARSITAVGVDLKRRHSGWHFEKLLLAGEAKGFVMHQRGIGACYRHHAVVVTSAAPGEHCRSYAAAERVTAKN